MTVLNPEALTPVTSSPLPDLDAVRAYAFPAAMVARLQAEQGWTTAFTLRALEEYRRFLILAASAPHPVTPSQVVDEVWHLHLTFTRDYWERLTPLLPAPLHHEPGVGEVGEDARFRAQYEQTLDLYARTFAQTAPPLYWPDPRSRSERGDQLQQRQLMVSPPPPRRAPSHWWAIGVALGLTWLVSVLFEPTFAVLVALFGGLSLLLSWLLGGPTSPEPKREAASGGETTRTDPFSFFGSDSSGPSCDPDSSGADGCSDGGGSSCGSGCGGGCSS